MRRDFISPFLDSAVTVLRSNGLSLSKLAQRSSQALALGLSLGSLGNVSVLRSRHIVYCKS